MPLVRSLLVLGVLSLPAAADDWPQWRGPTGDSVSTATGLPLKWDEKTNVVWKCPLPADGASTPIIWGDAIFLTGQQDDRLFLFKINKGSGVIDWTQLDPTAGQDHDLLTPGNQGERRHLDRLTVSTYELGHLLGYDHAEEGATAESLMAGTRRTPAAASRTADPVLLDQVFAGGRSLSRPGSFWETNLIAALLKWQTKEREE